MSDLSAAIEAPEPTGVPVPAEAVTAAKQATRGNVPLHLLTVAVCAAAPHIRAAALAEAAELLEARAALFADGNGPQRTLSRHYAAAARHVAGLNPPTLQQIAEAFARVVPGAHTEKP